jgi:hypothetical protein
MAKSISLLHAGLKLGLAALVIAGSWLDHAKADSFLPSTPDAFTSPSGTCLVRMEAAKTVKDPRGYWVQTELSIFAYDKPSEDYRRTARFNIEGHPGLVFINDAGTHIITLDQRFGSGYGQIAAIYNPKGERLAQWTLGDLFKIDNHFHPKALPQFRRSTSSIYWRGEARWDSNQKSIHIGAPRQIEYREDGSYSISHSSEMETYTMDLEKLEMKIIPSKTKKGNNSAPSKK